MRWRVQLLLTCAFQTRLRERCGVLLPEVNYYRVQNPLQVALQYYLVMVCKRGQDGLGLAPPTIVTQMGLFSQKLTIKF